MPHPHYQKKRSLMPKYKKKPVIVEANRLINPMTVVTLEGEMKGNVGDWVITGVAGEQYFCKNDIFQKTYELVVEHEIHRHEVG